MTSFLLNKVLTEKFNERSFEIGKVLKIHNKVQEEKGKYEWVRGLRSSWLELRPLKKAPKNQNQQFANKGVDYPEAPEENQNHGEGRYRGTEYPEE